ncbi:MAG TPA: phosphatase, partial [Alcanivorax sp.]|nr:phosphatase [Alcanivorax sp.]
MTTATPQRFAAVLFDLDGTLADTRLDFTVIRAEVGVPEGIGVLEYLDRLEDAARAEQGRQR